MRVISWFSCGAASAIATVLAAIKHGDIRAVYCMVRDEHEDNVRFMDDFTRTFGIPVEVTMNKQYDGSIYNVFLKRKYISNQHGAPCTSLLKKEVRRQYERPDDLQVFGFTVEEQHRADRFIDANNHVREWFPLIDNSVTKKDCLDLIVAAGIELPVMYKLGYSNNNCIGCVKGKMGYWNKIRVDFPDRFQKMARLERTLGHAINKDKKGPIYLDELDPKRGHLLQDMPGDCGFTCESK